jgi:aspartate/methionine/tyrosine aminotransferase
VFPEIEYLSWIDGRPAAVAHDLASSDLRPATRSRNPVPERLAALPEESGDSSTPVADRSLEAMLADVYDVTPEEVLLTPGATSANALAFAVAATDELDVSDDAGVTRDTSGFDATESYTTGIDATDPDADAHDDHPVRILVERPGYEPLVATPRAFGATVDRFRRQAGVLDAARIDAAITDYTALVAITDRHNPTGVRADRDELAAAAQAARDNDTHLLVDEVYGPFTATPTDDPFGAPSLAGTDGVVVTGSLTKFLGFGGLRIGWLVADPAFVSAAERVQRHFQSVAAPSRTLARRALHHFNALAAPQRERIARNHEALASFRDDQPGIAGIVHDGATYGLFTHDTLDGDELAARALDADVLVVPGRFFDRPDAVRISLGRPHEHATAALDALGTVLDDL